MDEERKKLIYREYARIYNEITIFDVNGKKLPGSPNFMGVPIDLDDPKQVAVTFYYYADSIRIQKTMDQLEKIQSSGIEK